MNPQRAVRMSLSAGTLAGIGMAIKHFAEMNTPEVGLTPGGLAVGVGIPALMSAICAALRAFHGFHPDAKKPLFGSKAERPRQIGGSEDKLMNDTLKALRKINSDLANDGRYDELAVLSKAERQIAGMFR